MRLREIIRDRKARRKLWTKLSLRRARQESSAIVRLGRGPVEIPIPEPVVMDLACISCRYAFQSTRLEPCPACGGRVHRVL